MDTSNPLDVERFVKDLGVAITKDMSEIRETELDSSGSNIRVNYKLKKGVSTEGTIEVFEDRMGRLVFPNDKKWEDLSEVKEAADSTYRKVLKKEPRYAGVNVTAIVVYLEKKADHIHD